jgi:hypothetical protein
LKAFRVLIFKEFQRFANAPEGCDSIAQNETRGAALNTLFGMLGCARMGTGTGARRMRGLIAIAVIIAAVAAADPAQAQFRFGGAHSGAWCLFDDPYTYNCGFATLQQCVATARGAGGQCQPNPSGPPPGAEDGRRRLKRSGRD